MTKKTSRKYSAYHPTKIKAGTAARNKKIYQELGRFADTPAPKRATPHPLEGSK